MSIRAGATPQNRQGQGRRSPPIAERSELCGELGRVVYGRAESVRHERGGLLDERQRLGRWKEAGGPGKKNGQVEQDTDERVPVVADLKRLDAEGTVTLLTGDGGCALNKSPRQDFQPQRCDQNDRPQSPQDGTQPTAESVVHFGEVFHYKFINNVGK